MRAGSTPASRSLQALTAFRSTVHFSPLGAMYASAPGPKAARRASGTSSWVSKQQGPMPAPMATRMFSGRAPNSRPISATVLAGRSRAVPRQPAWTAPMEAVTGSWSSRMMQSAENTISPSPGSSVTRASAV